jgi:glutathione peroxidase
LLKKLHGHFELATRLFFGKLLLTGIYGFVLVGVSSPAFGANVSNSCPSQLNHAFPRLQDEAKVSLCKFSGEVLLVVNTASYCGYTNQYDDLEKLHSRYQKKGFTVVGFPSNDFGGQEPKSNKEIADFCYNTFGVKFPMFAKTKVRGADANPFYKQLIQQSGQEPSWNFFKYLVGRDGKVIKAYPSNVQPSDSQLVQDIERALISKN